MTRRVPPDTPCVAARAEWQAIEDRLTWYLQAKGIVQRPGGQTEEPSG
jgi:hypothetical protein